MRRYSLLAGVFLAVLCTGCLDSDEGFLHFSFTIDQDVPEQTLPGDPLLALLPPSSLPDIPIPVDAGGEINSQAFDHLVRIRLKQLVFAISTSSSDPAVDTTEPDPPTPDDWSFLDSVEIWIRHPVTSEEALIAYIAAGDPQLEPGTTAIVFNCLDTDMLDYFDSAYNTTLIIRAVGTVPPDNVIFGGSVTLKVTAALIK